MNRVERRKRRKAIAQWCRERRRFHHLSEVRFRRIRTSPLGLGFLLR